MKKLLLLTKVGLSGLLDSKQFSSGKSRKAGKAGTIFLFSFLFVYLAAVSGGFSYGMYIMLATNGLQMLVPVLFIVSGTLLILLSSIFTAHGFLYRAKDLQLLLSLPVTHRDVLISKFACLYVYNLLFSFVLCLPSGIVYLIGESANVWQYISLVLIAVLLPLLPLAVGSLISYLIGMLTRKSRKKNLFTIVFSVILFVGIMIVSQNMNSVLNYLAISGGQIYNTITMYYFPAAWMLKALDGNALYLLLFTLLSVAPYVIVFPLIARKYSVIVAAYNQSFKKEHYKYSAGKRSSKYFSCLRKELSRLFSSANYFMNSCAGALMLIVFAVMIFAGQGVGEIFATPETRQYTPFFISLSTLFSCTLASSTSCSISLEGKSIWIYKSAPIDAKTIFNAKLSVNMIVMIPLALIYSVVMSIYFGLSPIDAVIAILFPIICIVYSSLLGLTVNLAKPKLDWTNEIQVIKQSASTLIMMLAGFGTSIITAAISLIPAIAAGVPFAVSTGAVCVIMIAVCLILYRALNTWGVRQFDELC